MVSSTQLAAPFAISVLAASAYAQTSTSTSSVGSTGVPLYIPPIGDTSDDHKPDVQYVGEAYGGSTAWQVVVTDSAGDPVTQTLIEDATGAELLGGQNTAKVSGSVATVWAGASCGFADGLGSEGYCQYYENIPGVGTTSYSDGGTTIRAVTTVTPTPGQLAKSKASASTVTAQTNAASVAASESASSAEHNSLAGMAYLAIAAGAGILLVLGA